MNNLNSIILEGNLVREGTLTEPSQGFKVYKMSVAVNRFYKNKNDQGVEEVSFFDVESYGKLADYCSKQSTKGRGIRIVGRLKQDTWKNSEGKNSSRVYVVAEHIEFKPMSKTDYEKSETKKSEVAETPSHVVTTKEKETEEVAFQMKITKCD